MSIKNDLKASMMAVVARLGGAHLTREARTRTVQKFVALVHAAGLTHLRTVEDIKGAQLRFYLKKRSEEVVSPRTLQNEAAHLRTILRAVGRSAIADAAELDNKALGIGGGSRLGTKTAMSDSEVAIYTDLAIHQGRPGMGAVLLLERALGLRGNEAIHARGDTLERWAQELRETGSVRVISGTKGGRQRRVWPKDTSRAREAVDYALPIATRQGGFLIERADGTPTGGLKAARSIYHAWAHRAGFEPHAARYAFARDQVDAYRASGMSEREALAATSLDLGHGDGRGRWVKSVYVQ